MPAQVWREALIAGGVTFLLTVVIVGFETVSGTGELRLRPASGSRGFRRGRGVRSARPPWAICGSATR